MDDEGKPAQPLADEPEWVFCLHCDSYQEAVPGRWPTGKKTKVCSVCRAAVGS